MSSYTFKCSCKAELVVDDSAEEAMKVLELWQLHHAHGAVAKTEKEQMALRARQLQDEGMTLRQIAAELGISHPQSVKNLMETHL